MEQQHYDSVLAMLEQYEGNTKQKDIAKRLMEIAISMVDTHNSQYFKKRAVREPAFFGSERQKTRDCVGTSSH